jgi:protein SCO1
MRRYGSLVAVGVVIGLVLVGVIALTRPYNFHGSLIDPPIPAYDFSLENTDGQKYQLSDQQGKLVMMFFGYTTCPDICPATLGEMRQLRQRLGRDAERVDFVFVTVDPQRDTHEKLGNYVHAFDPAFIGLTGSEADLQPVWQSYGVYREISETSSAVGYLVDHTTRVYLIDRSGNLRLTYTFGTPLTNILQDVRHLLRSG